MHSLSTICIDMIICTLSRYYVLIYTSLTCEEKMAACGVCMNLDSIADMIMIDVNFVVHLTVHNTDERAGWSFVCDLLLTSLCQIKGTKVIHVLYFTGLCSKMVPVPFMRETWFKYQ